MIRPDQNLAYLKILLRLVAGFNEVAKMEGSSLMSIGFALQIHVASSGWFEIWNGYGIFE